MCLWPAWFALWAYGFAVLCAVTIVTRLWAGWRALRLRCDARAEGRRGVAMNKNKLLLALVLVVLIVAFFAFDLGRYLSLAYLKSSQADFAALYAARPALVIGVYFAGLRRGHRAVAARRGHPHAGRRRDLRPAASAR